MKVLWVFSGGIFKNGICVSQLDYLKKINKDIISIDILTINASSGEMISQFRNYSCKVHILPNKRKHLFNYISSFKRILKNEKYDIIHVHGSSTLLFVDLMIAKKSGVKIRIAHSRNTSSSYPFLESVFRPIFNRSYNVALACGNDAGKWLFKEKNFKVFHNGKDLAKYKFKEKIRNEYRKELNIEEKIAVGHVGVFSKQKNHSFLIDIFKEIHDCNQNTCLFLFGTGRLQQTIKEKVHVLGLDENVIFMNNKNNIEDYMQAMDIMLFPSLFEGLPNVVIEWQAAGLPCIISDKITQECVVSNLVKVASINQGVAKWTELFKHMIIYTDDERLKQSKMACESLIEKGFEIENNTRKLEKIYTELMNGRDIDD